MKKLIKTNSGFIYEGVQNITDSVDEDLVSAVSGRDN